MKAYAAGKLFWNTFKCERSCSVNDVVIVKFMKRISTVKGGHER